MIEEIAMFERTRERFAAWLTYRETLRQLDWLDPRILADAGIRNRREMIERAKAGLAKTRSVN
jgi:uncharacterized protein YjiS (DUF1127 family)